MTELWTRETVTARTDGHTAEARVAQCPYCGSRCFVVYTIGARALLHLQCADCTATFCDGHSCADEPDAGAGEGEALLPCGHPAAAYVDRPSWGWCAACAQQAEAALPPAQPSRRVPREEGGGKG